MPGLSFVAKSRGLGLGRGLESDPRSENFSSSSSLSLFPSSRTPSPFPLLPVPSLLLSTFPDSPASLAAGAIVLTIVLLMATAAKETMCEVIHTYKDAYGHLYSTLVPNTGYPFGLICLGTIYSFILQLQLQCDWMACKPKAESNHGLVIQVLS
ncbi:hypothetical protein J3F83DRAFT_755988 [Trichoderma novae-zelandiae]